MAQANTRPLFSYFFNVPDCYFKEVNIFDLGIVFSRVSMENVVNRM